MKLKMKRPLGLILVVCMVVSLIAGSAYAVSRHFEDAKGHWAEEAIQALAEKGVIHGYPDGLVHPDEIITRAEFAALVARALELPVPDEGDIPFFFSDLSGHWAEGDVETLIAAGIIHREDFGESFLPDQPITRMEMIRMLVRAIGKGNCTDTSSSGFTDTDGLSEADLACICAGKKYGIVDGYPDGTVQPGGSATRAEAFEMLVDTDKAKEQIKREDKEKAEDQSSDSGGGSSYVPAPQFVFSLSESIYVGEEISIQPESKHVSSVSWTVLKNDLPAALSDVLEGELTAKGGTIRFRDTGSFTLIATAKNSRGRTVTHEQTLSVYPVITAAFTLPETAHTDTSVPVELTAEHLGANQVVWSLTDSAGRVTIHSETITVTNTAPDAPTVTAELTRETKDGKFLVNLSASATDPDGDEVALEWDGRAADSYYSVGTHTLKVRAKDIAGACSPWTEKSFTIVNTAPTVTLTAEPTRTAQGDKFLVNISATASDADGDETTLEWENRASDDYYAVGTHTVKVRAKDAAGLYSDWQEKTFTLTNSAPTTPVIHRTPGSNSVAPGTPVTITASSNDPDGDAITLVWEGRNAETQTYPLGRNVIRVKAVDSTGAESPWAAIVFFVADATNGGGMTLTGPESVILENGLEGATITEYTFTVPPVSGHSGSDYGRVRGYNILTKQWDQLDYGTTSNGITFQRTLGSGVYSRLEFYYYTNHDCMYNKSNITYSVTYHFE